MVTGETAIVSVRLFELIVYARLWNYEDMRGLTRAVRGTKTMSWHVARVNGCQWCQLATDVLTMTHRSFVILLLSAVTAQARAFVQSKKIHRNKFISHHYQSINKVITISHHYQSISIASTRLLQNFRLTCQQVLPHQLRFPSNKHVHRYCKLMIGNKNINEHYHVILDHLYLKRMHSYCDVYE